VKRILPISSVRFFLALWVFLGHFGYPILRETQHSRLLWALRGLLQNSFSGPAAVIAFFVISGFCIHFPNRQGLATRSWTQFYFRRYLRILVPMAVAMGLAVPLNLRFGIFSDSILWSLLCEEIYYFLYPLLLRIRSLFGWRILFSFAGLASLAVILSDPAAKNYPSYGPSLNWVLGLPCWLLGMRMAECLEVFRARPVSTVQIWVWRCGIWTASVAASVLRFHTPVGYPWTLNIFAIFAALWLQREISYYDGAQRIPVFERLGDASYSVYLTHVHGAMLVSRLSIMQSVSAVWWLTVFVSALFSTLFYWCIERPSHGFARRYSGRLALRNRTPALVRDLEIEKAHARPGQTGCRQEVLRADRVVCVPERRDTSRTAETDVGS
jgi:peptidoglycan/LPS O-acetylase OafA/YrhL